ncbi:hypothetical protein SK128_011871, partial [Halocaridina rubra]
MASNAYQYSDEEIRFIKFSFMIRKVAVIPLLLLLSKETENKRDSESLFALFQRKNRKISVIVKGKEKDKLSNATDLNSLDITFLYKCLRYGTEKLADGDDYTQWKAGNSNIESMITEVKNLRNEVSHEDKRCTEKKFLEETDKLEKLLESILNHIGRIYSINVHQYVQEIKMKLTDYRDNAVEDKELAKYRFERQCETMKTVGKDNIKKMIRQNREVAVKLVNHVVDMSLDVSEVFTEVKMKISHSENEDVSSHSEEEEMSIHSKNEVSSHSWEKKIKFEDILLKIKGRSPNPTILLIGVAGAGKTTIVKKILHEYESGKFTIKGLESYDIVLHHECRNMSTNSLKSLLEEKMPGTVKYFKDDELRQTALHLKTMVILDGLDELNEASARLFYELLNLKKTYDISIIITTRPEKLPYLESHLKSKDLLEILLVGIPHEKRAAFVKKYYNKLAKKDLENKPIDKLVNYLEKYRFILDRLLYLPYNLVFITVLYIFTCLILDDIKTASLLYREIHNLCRTKLVERLRVHESTNSWEESKIKWTIDIFLYALAKVSLIGLLNDQINLPSEAYERLANECNYCSVPVEQMVSAFLRPNYTSSSQISYSFPHKGFQEYLAARYVWLQLTETYQSSEHHNLCARISSALSSNSIPPKLSYNIMQFVQNEITQRGFSNTKHHIQFGGQKTLADVKAALLMSKAPLDITNKVLDDLRGKLGYEEERLQPTPGPSRKVSYTGLKKYVGPLTNTLKATLRLDRVKSTSKNLNFQDLEIKSMDVHSLMGDDNTVMEILEEVQKESSLQSQTPSLNETVPKHDITKLQNMFVCLLGISHSEGIAVQDKVKLEILQLLQETGVRERSHWLDILSSVNCDNIVAEFISKQNEILEGDISIQDFTLHPYVSLLKTLTVLPKHSTRVKIHLHIRHASTNIKALVDELFRLKIHIAYIFMTHLNIADYLLVQHNIQGILTPDHEVHLKLHKEPPNLREVLCMINNLKMNITKFRVEDHLMNFITTDAIYCHKLIETVNRCKLWKYSGVFLEGMQLPNEIEYLYVSVSSCRDYKSLCQQLKRIENSPIIGISLSKRLNPLDIEEALPDRLKPLCLSGGIVNLQ